MQKVRHEARPEVYERSVFPFRPSRPPSPCECSRLGTPALEATFKRAKTARLATPSSKKHQLTAHGGLTAVDGPTLQPTNAAIPRWTPRKPPLLSQTLQCLSARGSADADGGSQHRGDALQQSRVQSGETWRFRGEASSMDLSIGRHTYRDSHTFGIHMVENNVNPFIAHEKMPSWQKSSESYGVHYKHPLQTYSRPYRNRLPQFQIHL
eukprot:TRINITY_DN15176_c0_g1_i1.p1 TRINITY_DN15176_c0_g1~~TRINITY_DN15176_c0_g1_i1.p1  ORF type:complete len:209 (-),score=27.89 TRINITY_DN15176_c0_g1_i1:117-743(-)